MQNIKKKLFGFWQRRTVGEHVLYAIVFLVFACFALSYLYCLAWCVIAGLKTHNEVVLDSFGLPEVWHFSHYIELFETLKVGQTNFFGMVVNSLYFSVIGGFLATMCTAMVAYVTSKYKFPGAGIYFVCSLVMMILPIYGTGGSMYLLLESLNFINSPLMIITSTSGLGIYYMYFHAFYQNVSWSYAEAAQLDGAGDYSIFFRVMLPQALPMFGAVFLLIWMTEWNNYANALLYLPDMPTLAVGIFMFQDEMVYNSRLDILYAGCFVSCIPPLALFICFNKVLMSNISLGGIKE